MKWISQIFSSATSKVVDSIGNAIDKNVTNEEERLTLRNELAKEMNSFKKEQLKFITTYQTEISNRHSNDMKSDSWLSKNVRPLALVFLTLTAVVMAFLTTMNSSIEIEKVEPWIGLFNSLLITVYGFYFGSRGLEKAVSIRGDYLRKIAEAKK